MIKEKMLLTLFGEDGSEGAGDSAAEESVPAEVETGSPTALAESDRDRAGDEMKGLRSRLCRALLSERLRARRAEREYGTLMAEASALSSENRDFDIRRELSDRRFSAMIRSGLSVSEAYRAIHAAELIEKAREEAKSSSLAAALEEIRLQSLRPDENGAAKTSGDDSPSGVEHLSGKGIRDILRRVEKGAKIKF